MKMLVNFSIEESVWLAFKTVVPMRERSLFLENVMRATIKESAPTAEESEVIENIKKNHEQMEALRAEQVELSVQLAIVQKKKCEEQKAAQEKLHKLAIMSDRYDPVRDLG